jgi:hypothetical protein
MTKYSNSAPDDALLERCAAQPAKRVRVPTPAPSHAKRPALLGIPRRPASHPEKWQGSKHSCDHWGYSPQGSAGSRVVDRLDSIHASWLGEVKKPRFLTAANGPVKLHLSASPTAAPACGDVPVRDSSPNHTLQQATNLKVARFLTQDALVTAHTRARRAQTA